MPKILIRVPKTRLQVIYERRKRGEFSRGKLNGGMSRVRQLRFCILERQVDHEYISSSDGRSRDESDTKKKKKLITKGDKK